MQISVPIDVKKFIEKEIERPIRNQIVPVVQQAYELVDAGLKEISFLNWDLGKKHTGYLDHIAVQFMLYESVNKGKFKNITAQIVPNVNKSSYHVELKTNNVIICINRAESKEVTARRAIYRSILQKNNQYYWNFDEQEINEEPGYLELTHNHIDRKVDFVNIGLPDGRGKWFDFIDLTRELRIVETPIEVEKNDITKEQLVRFKNFAQGVHENGGKN